MMSVFQDMHPYGPTHIYIADFNAYRSRVLRSALILATGLRIESIFVVLVLHWGLFLLLVLARWDQLRCGPPGSQFVVKSQC